MLTIIKNYICDDCGTVGTFQGYRQARAAGWAISKSYTKCYCPNCAPDHRRGKAADKNACPPQWLPSGFEQIKIKNLG